MAVKLRHGKTPEQDKRDRDWGADLRVRAFRLWRELTGAGIVETEPQYAHVDGLAVPIQPNDRPYFLEVQSRRNAILDFPTLMFDQTQYDHILDYHRDLGFPTVLLSVWRDGLGHLLLPWPHGDPVWGEQFTNQRQKVMLGVECFDWVKPDLFRKHFPEDLFAL